MAKQQNKARKPMQVWKLYDSKGSSVLRKSVFCPKCGPGVFLAKHSTRVNCGKCGYTVMAAKK